MGEASMGIAENESDIEELTEEIHETQRELGGILHALHEKLTPEHVKEKIGEKVHEATVGRASHIAHAVGDKLVDARETVGEKFDEARETVGEFAAPASEAAGRVAGRVKQEVKLGGAHAASLFRRIGGYAARYRVPLTLAVVGIGIFMGVRLRRS